MERLAEPLNSMALVLYQPQDVVNVAAIIRAMSNFGLADLRLVEPAAFDPYRIAGIAHHTEPLIERTRRFPTLDAALADCGLVLGTTGRPRVQEYPVYTPREAAREVLARARQQRVAILFGPEQDGLPNEALGRCHGVITIPTHPFNHSLNLAQAAVVIAYELWVAASGAASHPWAQGEGGASGATPDRVAHAGAAAGPALAGTLPAKGPSVPGAGETAEPLASGAEREALFASLEGLLVALYPGGSPARRAQALARLRALLMRAQPTRAEAAALTNLLRHAARACSGGRGGNRSQP